MKTFLAVFLAIMSVLAVLWIRNNMSEDEKITRNLDRVINEGKSREELAHDAAMYQSDQMRPTTVEEEKKRRAEIARRSGLNPDKE